MNNAALPKTRKPAARFAHLAPVRPRNGGWAAFNALDGSDGACKQVRDFPARCWGEGCDSARCQNWQNGRTAASVNGCA